MEKRFGIKDLVVCALLAGLILVVVLAMVQFDRQYDQVLTIKAQNDQLSSEMARIKRQLGDLAAAGPIATTGAGQRPPSAPAGLDAFTHIREAEKMPGFARGGTLVDNFPVKIGRITPLVSQDTYSMWINYLVAESLAVRDPNTMEFVPRLAKSWTISPDGLTMRFFLREDVTFSDGHPLTADDVVFTYDWVRNPEVDAARDRSQLTTFKSLKKIDDYTVEFTFTEPYFKNFEAAAFNEMILPKHFYSRFTPKEFNEKVGLLMGSGPYMLENPETWTPGNGVTLVRNPRYWSVAPTYDKLVFHEIQDEAAEEVSFGNQEQDLLRATPETFARLSHDPRILGFADAFNVVNPYNGYSYVAWNQKRKVDGRDIPTAFADKRVRQAMTLLIDRQTINKEIMFGYYAVATGPFLPGNPQSDPSIKPWPFDPARAIKLLAEAGFEDRNKDGVLEDRDGRPLKFKISYAGGSRTTEKLILFIRDNLAKGGVVMEPDRLDWPVLLNKLNLNDFDSVILAWSSEPESDIFQMFHSSQIADQGDNRTGYISPELDKALVAARSTMDVAKRMELWHQVHRILNEDQPYTFLVSRSQLRLFNKRVQNVTPSAIGQNFEYLNPGVIPWFTPRGLQRSSE